jgi:hypothetical protein
MKTMEVEDEHPALSENEVDSMKIMMERLPSVPIEETVGDPTSVESPVKMWRPRKSYIVASKAYSQEIEESSSEQGTGGFGATPKYQGSDSQNRV